MNFRTLLFVVSLSALSPICGAQEIQKRAEELVQHARRLSDIRSPNAPAFRLKATFSFTGKNLETAHGTYTEIWLSNSQWRRETIVNNTHRIEVGTADRIWRLDNSTDFPEAAARLPDLINVFPQPSRTFEFESITDVTDQKIAEQCATTLPGSQKEKYRFCFDQKSGALLAKLSPQFRPKNLTDYSCFYGIFRKFGDFWFPREMACLEDKHRTLEAKVEDLSIEPAPDAALFQPPPGASELGRCLGTSALPVQTFSPEPDFPMGSHRVDASVLLSLVVDTQGKPRNINVTQSAGKDLDGSALAAIGRWRFKPATCDGKPMPVEINVRLEFRLYQ
jgi:TonB family protein